MPPLESLQGALKGGLLDQVRRWNAFGRELTYYERRNGEATILPRPAEDPASFEARQKPCSRLTYRVIEALGQGLYRPGPSRTYTGSAEVEAWYEDALARNVINDLLQRADKLAWLHGVFAIQVAPGNARRPVCLYPWRADEFAVWCVDDDPAEPWAVLVRSAFPDRDQLRYQLWSAEEVHTFWSQRGDTDPSRPRNDLIFDRAHSAGHGLGILPFVFVHNETPIAEFWTPGLGRGLVATNATVDVRLADLDEAIATYCIPRLYSRNLSEMQRLVHRPGSPIDLIDTGDPNKVPEVFHVQPELLVDQVWVHIRNLVNLALRDLGLPMEFDGTARVAPESGIALALREHGLATLWQARIERFKAIERELFRVVATVAGRLDDRPDLRAAGLRPEDLEVTFPEPRIPMPSADRTEQDLLEIAQGWKSRTQVLMERYGLTRDQALRRLRRVEQDRLDEQAILDEVGAPARSTPGAPAIPSPPRGPSPRPGEETMSS